MEPMPDTSKVTQEPETIQVRSLRRKLTTNIILNKNSNKWLMILLCP